MLQLLKEIDQVLDLSPSETRDLVSCFRRFIDRNFNIEPEVLENVFTIPASHLLNMQEDEDNVHASMNETVYY